MGGVYGGTGTGYPGSGRHGYTRVPGLPYTIYCLFSVEAAAGKADTDIRAPEWYPGYHTTVAPIFAFERRRGKADMGTRVTIHYLLPL